MYLNLLIALLAHTAVTRATPVPFVDGPAIDHAQAERRALCPLAAAAPAASLIKILGLQPVCSEALKQLVSTSTVTVTTPSATATATKTSVIPTTTTSTITEVTTSFDTETVPETITTTSTATSTSTYYDTYTYTVVPSPAPTDDGQMQRRTFNVKGFPAAWTGCADNIALGQPKQSVVTTTRTVAGPATTVTTTATTTSKNVILQTVTATALATTTTTSTTTATATASAQTSAYGGPQGLLSYYGENPQNEISPEWPYTDIKPIRDDRSTPGYADYEGCLRACVNVPDCVQNGNYIFFRLIQDRNYAGVGFTPVCSYGPTQPIFSDRNFLNLYGYTKINS